MPASTAKEYLDAYWDWKLPVKPEEIARGISGVKFDQEKHDTPGDPSPWGVGGWSEDAAHVVICHLFDI